jgi:uncharacterized protein YjdB
VHILKGQKDLKSMTYATSQNSKKQKQAYPQTSIKTEIIKIRAKINEIERHKQKKYKESMKQKVGFLKTYITDL